MSSQPHRLTYGELQSLRGSLPCLAEGVAPSGQMAHYCAEYGLDPESRYTAVQHRVGTVSSGAFSLLAHLWLQPGATRNLVLVHGYFDHSGLYGQLVDYGLTQNANVLIFDLPGHGLSSGAAAAITDFSQYGRAIADAMGAAGLPALPNWVIAQSMGAAAVVEYARGYPWPFTGAVLLAPLVRPTGWAGINLAYALVGRILNSVPRGFAVNSSDTDFLAFVKDDPLQSHRVPLTWVRALRRWVRTLPLRDLGVGPALVIQGDADGTVDWRHNLPWIGTLFPGSRVEMLAGAGHHLANESGPLMQAYLSIISDYLLARPEPQASELPGTDAESDH